MSSSQPSAGGAGTAAPLAIVGAIFGGGALFTGAWLGGTLGAALAGGGWAPPPFTLPSAVHLVTRGPSALWPAAPTGAVTGMLVLLVLLAAAATAGGIWAWRHFSPRTGLGRARDMAALGPKEAEARARKLRPALADVKEIAPKDLGVRLGRLEPSGPNLYGSDEDTFTAVMGPRAGKSTSLAIPVLLDAPGAALLTSNRNDVYATTRRARERAGNTWTLDLQQVAYAERELWWDILSSARSVEGARRLAMHFVNADADTRTKDDFWQKAGSNTLMALFHAAALSGATVLDVLAWLDTPSDRAPVNALKAHNPAMASRLASTVSGAVETRDGIYETARQATSCLLDPQIAAWVTPDKHRPQFDPYAFVTSTDTLYLLSKDGGGSAAAICAAAADIVFRGATIAAERNGSGRLPVPLRAILDEAANVCRIADLPQQYSHLGGRGINPFTFLQSYKQGANVWGDTGMDALWVASTVKLIGASQDDAKFAEDMSKLIGRHKIKEMSTSHSSSGRSTSVSPREEDIMQTSQIRAIPRGHALAWASGTPVGRLKLLPWYEEPYAAELSTDKAAEEKGITTRANATEVIL
ncbi:TraM recognition domain-containing protein [Streptomyces sp. NPDC051162]|uniref:type IV secretory system conjugative DNA transfer family protein n=1 Tax=Streptomyces sp. NPDC051162 TaxID=3154747 RepID=UPI0034412586